ncbi:MAG TPA: type II secretion system protein GspF, partial [Nitrospirae bacterium]|nr:type II secretion system protein GspF [Nitrospirota bacterium]
MESFSYEATTRDGSMVTGMIEADNRRLAVDMLQERGYYPLKVDKAAEQKSFISGLFESLQARVGEKDIMGFTYQLGVLLDAGFPLDRSLSILSDLTDKKSVKELISGVLSQVRGGKSFSESLSKYPAVFPVFYVNMVRSGEAGGFLEETISRMAVYLENIHALKEDVRSAMIYPIILAVFGGAAVILLLTFVVPKFSMIFTDMGETLPLA